MNKKEKRILNIVFELLKEYDRSCWENIKYIDLADVWLNILDCTKFDWDNPIDRNELVEKRKKLLYDYLFNNKKIIAKTVVNYEIVEDDYEEKTDLIEEVNLIEKVED